MRNDLAEVYTGVRCGKLGNDEAKTASNVAGKIIATAKTQMEYNKMVQSKERIPFLETSVVKDEKVQ